MGAAVVTKYPLDFDTLEKGMWIEGKQLADAIDVKRDHPLWGLKLSSLCDRIHDEREDLWARVDHDRIRVMTDEEASEYGWRRTKHLVRGLVRTGRRLARVDLNALTPEQKTLHEHRLRASTGIAIAARSQLKKDSRILALLSGTATTEEEGKD